jgi:uncharacterized protein
VTPPVRLERIRLSGRGLVPGRGQGEALTLDEPLSFWGGMDPDSGRLIDPHHRQQGADLRGRVLLMPSGRGSSSSSSVLAEAVRLGTAPSAVVLLSPDPIVAMGSIVAAELYGQEVPVVVLEPGPYGAIRPGDHVEVHAEKGHATLWVVRPGEPQT